MPLPIKTQFAASSVAHTKLLDTPLTYGVYCHMPKAKLILHTKYVDEQGGLVEMKA